ncbi:hypothetical protein Pvag_0625 [Pantoea vagans C9-1]|jgi:hypothetical protein|nr:hypothetical protein Pvag_0625 [Pantoea vagans C9-1]
MKCLIYWIAITALIYGMKKGSGRVNQGWSAF